MMANTTSDEENLRQICQRFWIHVYILFNVDALDSVSLIVLRSLGRSARPGVLDLSRQLHLARATVQARIDRLSATGVVTGYGPDVDLRALGFMVTAFCSLQVSQGHEQPVIDGLRSVAQVLEAHKTTGDADLLCRVIARSNDELHSVLNHVLALPGVIRTTTAIVLNSPIPLPPHPVSAELLDLLSDERHMPI
jgi:DNA-binding Lrp family transcriptional regulator